MSTQKHVLGPRSKDLRGSPPFDRLTVIEYAGRTRGGDNTWLCRCQCGKLSTVTTTSLTSGNTKSCGCKRAELIGLTNLSHGYTRNRKRTNEYVSWKAMRQRCYDPAHSHYECHGGRGITMCQRWRESFVAFLEDMGQRPSDGHSIDRINNATGHYSCGKCDECVANKWTANCRWVDAVAQARNRRTNLLLTLRNETLCVAAWVEKLGIPGHVIYRRIAAGWPAERALTTPARKLRRPRKAA